MDDERLTAIKVHLTVHIPTVNQKGHLDWKIAMIV